MNIKRRYRFSNTLRESRVYPVESLWSLKKLSVVASGYVLGPLIAFVWYYLQTSHWDYDFVRRSLYFAMAYLLIYLLGFLLLLLITPRYYILGQEGIIYFCAVICHLCPLGEH